MQTPKSSQTSNRQRYGRHSPGSAPIAHGQFLTVPRRGSSHKQPPPYSPFQNPLYFAHRIAARLSLTGEESITPSACPLRFRYRPAQNKSSRDTLSSRLIPSINHNVQLGFGKRPVRAAARFATLQGTNRPAIRPQCAHEEIFGGGFMNGSHVWVDNV